MKSPQRVVWSEGMLVSPQHLQQQDLYHERLLNGRLATLTPYGWGVGDAELDVGALGTGQVKVARFAGAFADGLFVSFDAGDPEAPPARAIGNHFAPAQPMLEVFLGSPKEREGVPSVAVSETGAGRETQERARYRAATRTVADLTGGGMDLAMGFAERNLVLLFGSERRDDFETIKIAEVVRDGAGALTVNEAYIPPVLRVGASPFLAAGARRLLALMVAKQRQLSDERRHRDASTVEFGTNDVTRYLQLAAVNGAIPVLSHVGRAGDLPPLHLYLLLIQTAGQLATFSADTDPSGFPAFTYTDLRSTFEELFARVTGLLRMQVREMALPVPLDVQQGVHVGSLGDERILRCGQFVLAARSEMAEEELARKLPGLCKIASWTQLPYLLRAASPGVPVAVTHRPPAEVPVRSGVAYFTLDISNENWRSVIDEKKLAIYLPPPLDPSRVRLELFAIPTKAG